MKLITEQLKNQYAEMEKLEVLKYPCGKYRIATKGGVYWLNKDGSLELIYKYSVKQNKSWIALAKR